MKKLIPIVYSISLEDIQQVAEDELERELTKAEIAAVSNRLADYLDWYGAIESAIRDKVPQDAR